MSSSALTHHDEASIKNSVALMFQSLLERTNDDVRGDGEDSLVIDVPAKIASLQGLSLQLLHSSLRYHLPLPSNTGERDAMVGLCALSFLEPRLWETINMRWGVLFPDPSKPPSSSSSTTLTKRGAAAAVAKRGAGGGVMDTTRCQIPIAAPLKKDATLRFVQMIHRFVAEAEKEERDVRMVGVSSVPASLVNSATKDGTEGKTSIDCQSPDPTTNATIDYTPLTGHTPATTRNSSGRVTFPHIVDATGDIDINNRHSPSDGSWMGTIVKKDAVADDDTLADYGGASPLPHDISAPYPTHHRHLHDHTPATSSRIPRDSLRSGVSPSPIFDTTPSSTSASPRAPIVVSTTTIAATTTSSPCFDDAARALDYSSTSPLLAHSSMGEANSTVTTTDSSTSNPVVAISSDHAASSSPPHSRPSPPRPATLPTFITTASAPFIEGQLGVVGGAPMTEDKVASLRSRMARLSFVLPPPLQSITATNLPDQHQHLETNPLLRNTSPTTTTNVSDGDATKKRLEALFKSRREINCVVMPTSTSAATTTSSTTSPLVAASTTPVSVGSTLRTALGLYGVIPSSHHMATTSSSTSPNGVDVPTLNMKAPTSNTLSHRAAENLMRSWCGEISLEEEEEAAATAAQHHNTDHQDGDDDGDFNGYTEDKNGKKKGDVVVLRDIVRNTAELRAWKDNFSRRARGSAEAAEEAQIRQSDYFSMIAAALDFNVQRGQMGCKRPRTGADDGDDENEVAVTLGRDGEVITTTSTASTNLHGGGGGSTKRRTAPSVHPLTINFDAVAWECNNLIQRRHENPVVGVTGGENNVLLTAYQKHFAPRYVCGPSTDKDSCLSGTATSTTTSTVPLASAEALRCFVCGCGTGYIPPHQDESSQSSPSHSTRRRGRPITMREEGGHTTDCKGSGDGSHDVRANDNTTSPSVAVVAAAAILGGGGCGIRREATGTTDSALERVAGMLQCGSCQRVVHPRCVYPTQREIYGPFYCHSCRCMPVDLHCHTTTTSITPSPVSVTNDYAGVGELFATSPTTALITVAEASSPSTPSSHSHHHQQYFSTLFGAHNPSHSRNPFPSMKVSQLGLRNTTRQQHHRLLLASPLKRKASSRCSTTPIRLGGSGTNPQTTPPTITTDSIDLVEGATPTQLPLPQQGNDTDVLVLQHTPQRITSTSASSRSLVFPPTSSFSSSASRSLQLGSGGDFRMGRSGRGDDGEDDREVCVIASSSSSNSPNHHQLGSTSGENSNDSEPKNSNLMRGNHE